MLIVSYTISTRCLAMLNGKVSLVSHFLIYYVPRGMNLDINLHVSLQIDDECSTFDTTRYFIQCFFEYVHLNSVYITISFSVSLVCSFK